MIENLPLVTVNILSYNRKEELKNTLTKVFEQDYRNIEVIVVDNASTDGSPEMVEAEFSTVILIKLRKNIGIAGWNEGFKIARGEFVLVLDDDSYPNKKSLELAIEKAINNLNSGAIAFSIIDVNTGKMFWAGSWLPDKSIVETDWPVFVGCAVLFRTSLLNEEELFPSNLFLYQHELSVSSKIYSKNMVIYYHRNITAIHNCKLSTTYKSEIDKLVFRNNLIFILDYLPRFIFVFYVLQTVLFYLLRSIKRKWFIDYLLIISNAIKESGKFHSKKMDYRYFKSLRKLHLFNYPLLKKFKNFFR